MAGVNYTPSEGNVLVAALKATRIGSFCLCQPAELQQHDTVVAFLLQQRHRPRADRAVPGQHGRGGDPLPAPDPGRGVPLQDRERAHQCPGCQLHLPRHRIQHQRDERLLCRSAADGPPGEPTFGGVHTEYISSNYTVEVYSLIGQNYLTLAHANAGELISRLGMNYSSVDWQSLYKNSCAFKGGFACRFNNVESNGTVNMTLTDLDYTSVKLDNLTCGEGTAGRATRSTRHW